MTQTLRVDDLEWPEAVPIPAERVVSGSPATSTLVLHRSNSTECGYWRVTPGAFATDHAGYVEVIHILEGMGRLVSNAGQVISLTAGSAVVLEDGWVGRWEIDTTIEKVYTIIRSA